MSTITVYTCMSYVLFRHTYERQMCYHLPVYDVILAVYMSLITINIKENNR